MLGFIRRSKIALIIIAIAAIIPMLPMSRSTFTLIDLAGVYIVAAIGYNILLGYGGQISLGHAAFIGLGAYITANLAIRFNMPFIFTIPISGAVSGTLGILLGLPALRLEGNYLAIATLGFGIAINHIFMELEPLTGGFSGLTGIPAPSLFGYEIKSRQQMYYFILFFIVIAIIAAKNMLRTKTGRALMAIRDSEIAAHSMGVNLAKYKTIAFVISAVYAGVAGSLFAYLFRQVYPNTFDVALSLNLLAMVVIGGLGSVPGSIVGALFMTMFPEYIKKMNIQIVNGSYILTGVFLILVVMYSPYGVVQLYEMARVKLFRRFKRVKLTGKEA